MVYFDHQVPEHAPRGRLPGQTSPQWLIDSGRLPVNLDQGLNLVQRGCIVGNVEAYRYWVSDGRIEVRPRLGQPKNWTEAIDLHDATWAYCVTDVSVGGELVAHPMVWEAYAATQAARNFLTEVRLPRYRCMAMRGLRMMLANWYSFNGGWSYTPGDVMFACAYPDRIECPYLHYPSDWYLPAEAWPKVLRHSVPESETDAEPRDG